MIIGAHSIVYSKDADADREFFKDVLGLSHVDVGEGWLIFALPPAEVAVHPAKKPSQEVYLMTSDVAEFVAEMQGRGLDCTTPADQGWGVLTTLTLPGGGKLGVYEPRHARPETSSKSDPSKRKAKAKKAKSTPKKAAKASPARKAGKKR